LEIATPIFDWLAKTFLREAVFADAISSSVMSECHPRMGDLRDGWPP
jgi:hypothetical protein